MVKIVTDTTACLSPEYALAHDIPIVPQVINFGNDSFYEGVDIDIDTFMARLKSSSTLPQTAAPPPQLFTDIFKKLAPLGEPIICIHPSSEISGTVRSATLAAREFSEADIRVLDTHLIAGPLNTIVHHAAEAAINGDNADAIVALVNNLSQRCRLYFLVDTLDYLARGGRIGGATALLGSVLRIKPILSLEDGRVNSYEKERTHKRALARLKEIVLSQIPRDGTGFLTVMHADRLAEGQALATELGRETGQTDVPVLNMPPAIVTHGGPGLLAAGFFV